VGDRVLGGQVAAEGDAKKGDARQLQMLTQLLEVLDEETHGVRAVRWLVTAPAATLLVVDDRTDLLQRGAGQPFEVIDRLAWATVDHHQRCPVARVANSAHLVAHSVDHHARLGHGGSLGPVHVGLSTVGATTADPLLDVTSAVESGSPLGRRVDTGGAVSVLGVIAGLRVPDVAATTGFRPIRHRPCQSATNAKPITAHARKTESLPLIDCTT
jgi:hypothetical protein